jgi:hypothetical protein
MRPVGRSDARHPRAPARRHTAQVEQQDGRRGLRSGLVHTPAHTWAVETARKRCRSMYDDRGNGRVELVLVRLLPAPLSATPNNDARTGRIAWCCKRFGPFAVYGIDVLSRVRFRRKVAVGLGNRVTSVDQPPPPAVVPDASSSASSARLSRTGAVRPPARNLLTAVWPFRATRN